MRKFIQRLVCIACMAVAMPVFVSAQQQMPPIPVDNQVRIGKLDNGLTYYIRHNEYPKGQADFYIAQKVGSILEEDNQRGLAHFLEHMCFNGTKNFPGNEIVSWLESVGVKFGQNLNARTDVDETIYNISKVPTARESVQDSCLLILHDWADGLLLEDGEIDKERGVIHEEWRSTNVGSNRILENLLPLIYPGDRYAYRMPIGTMEVVDNFPYQALRDYYEKWYRPDQQCIAVVGDVDVDRIEGKIKEMFADIKMPENPAPRVYYPVADNDKPIIAIGKDKEQSRALVQLMFKREATPDSMKGNLDYLVELYVVNMITNMLNSRLSDIMSTPDAPFAVAQAMDGRFLAAKTKKALTLAGLAKGNDIKPVIESIYREALRAKRGGFTATEYDRARNEFLSALEAAYKNRNTQSSSVLVEEYVRNFIDNEPIPGIENEYNIMNLLAKQIPVEVINMAMLSLIHDKNLVVLAMLPDNGQFIIPTEAELSDVLTKVAAEDISAHVDEVKSEPLIAQLPKPGTVVSVGEDKLYGATVWTLSNGIKVVFKHTDFKDDEILFMATANGGTSVYGADDDLNLRFLPIAMLQSGLGSYTNSDLSKYLAGKQASVSVTLDDYARSVSGSCVVKDLPSLMELIYMTFTAYNITPDEFASTQNIYTGALHNQEASPEYQFGKGFQKDTYVSPRNYVVDVATIQNADRERILEIIHQQLADAGQFTFYFVGNVNAETLKPLVEQYIATLPKGAAPKEVKLAGLGFKKGASTDRETFKMDIPQTYVGITVTGDMPYTSKNQKLASIAGQILTGRLVKLVREDEGAVYSISAQGAMQRVSDNPVVMQSAFPMKPEMKDKVLGIIAEQFDDMSRNITSEELAKVKEFMVKSATEGLERNASWLSAMVGYNRLPVDTLTDAVDVINSITEDDVEAFMSQLMKQNNYRVYILDPAE